MPQPDMKVIIEVQLHRTGFSQYRTLAAKLSILFRMLQTQVCATLAVSYMYNHISKNLMSVVSTVTYELLFMLYLLLFWESFADNFIYLTMGFLSVSKIE